MLSFTYTMQFSEITLKYWQEKDWEDLANAKSIPDLFTIADRIINRLPLPIGQVCGPITNGGFNSIEKNLDFFNKNIKNLQSKGLNIFDQMPFEETIQKFKAEEQDKEKVYQSIIYDLYLPIFKSGKIKTFYFLPNWQTSKGAIWEHETAEELGIEIKYID